MSKKVIVIGSGFAGLSAATHLAHKGYEVTILEKNSVAGGRARVFEMQGFTFDMGPSWYWMPEIFDQYFESFGKKSCPFCPLGRPLHDLECLGFQPGLLYWLGNNWIALRRVAFLF